MSIIKYIKQIYKCPKCGKIQKQYIWSNELDTTVLECQDCKNDLFFKDLYKQPKPSVPGIRTDTKNRV